MNLLLSIQLSKEERRLVHSIFDTLEDTEKIKRAEEKEARKEKELERKLRKDEMDRYLESLREKKLSLKNKEDLMKFSVMIGQMNQATKRGAKGLRLLKIAWKKQRKLSMSQVALLKRISVLLGEDRYDLEKLFIEDFDSDSVEFKKVANLLRLQSIAFELISGKQVIRERPVLAGRVGRTLVVSIPKGLSDGNVIREVAHNYNKFVVSSSRFDDLQIVVDKGTRLWKLISSFGLDAYLVDKRKFEKRYIKETLVVEKAA